MDKYISNMLPRLRQYGKMLNKKEEFVDKTWVLYSDGKIVTYRFKRNGLLRKSIDGDYYDLHWELEGVDCIAISGENKRSGEIFNHGFVLDGLLVVQKEGRSAQPVIFYNKDVVRDGNVIDYIRVVIMTRENLVPMRNNGRYYVNQFNNVEQGAVIFDSDLCPVEDEEIWMDDCKVIVKHGRVVQKDYFLRLRTDKGEVLVISGNFDLPAGNLKVGDKVVISGKAAFRNNVFSVYDHFIKEITVQNGKISSFKRNRSFQFYALILVMILFLAIFSIIILDYVKKEKSSDWPNGKNRVNSSDSAIVNVVLDTAATVPVLDSLTLQKMEQRAYEKDETDDVNPLFAFGLDESVSLDQFLEEDKIEYWDVIFNKFQSLANGKSPDFQIYYNALREICKEDCYVDYGNNRDHLLNFIIALNNLEFKFGFVKSVVQYGKGKLISVHVY